MTHSEAVAIARSGEGAIVAELFRLTAENARLLDHVRFLQSQVYGKDVIIDEPFEERDRHYDDAAFERAERERTRRECGDC